jgi:hypothetical protein
VTPNAEDPPNSEVSEQFLNVFSSSPVAIADFEEAIQRDENGKLKPLKYDHLKDDFALVHLVCQYSVSSIHFP